MAMEKFRNEKIELALKTIEAIEELEQTMFEILEREQELITEELPSIFP